MRLSPPNLGVNFTHLTIVGTPLSLLLLGHLVIGHDQAAGSRSKALGRKEWFVPHLGAIRG
jgi:hypothetical protein